jgi:uncharacterized protein YcgL (UPF0745 family)
MYLYLPMKQEEADPLRDLPDGLGQLTGNLSKVMELDITPERKLARVKAEDVIAAIEAKGFYIQMPPHEYLRKDESMLHNPSDSF